MRVLLTGASGFVGSHVLEHLLTTTDAHVVCPVTFTHQGTTDRIRLVLDTDPSWAERVTVIKTDLTAPISPQTDDAFGHIDRVFNVASESHVDRSIESPAEFITNNVALICHLLDWMRFRGVSMPEVFVQVSTDEVYGPAPAGTAHQEWVDQHLPSNPYSASKAAQEDIAFSYWRTYDLPIVITNTMNIIGQRQHPEKFVPMVIKKILAGEEITIHGDKNGNPGSRFYLHARNQADGLLYVADWALQNEWRVDRGGPRRQVTSESLYHSAGGSMPYRFHIVGEREVDNLEMAEMIKDAILEHQDIMMMRTKITDFHSSRPGHDLRYALDGSKMATIGWKPPVPLDESLRTTVEWTLQHPEWLLE
jgi:dTDP-glucose 4,6-dehydratase